MRLSTMRLLLLIVAALCPLVGQGEPHTVEQILKESRVRAADLSPDGAHVAIAFRSEDQPGDIIGVIQTSRLGHSDAVKRFTLGEKEVVGIEWIRWATPTRMLIGISLTERLPTLSTRTKGAPLGSRVYAVNIDGSEPVVLFSNTFNVQRYGFNLSEVIEVPANDPENVIMPGWSGVSYDLYKVNIRTGVADRIASGSRNTIGWDAEDGRPALRYDINMHGTDISVYGCAPDQDKWALLTRYRRKLDKLDWKFAGDAPGAGKIYVRMRKEGSDTEGIYLYDIAKRSTEDLIASAPGLDMHDVLTVNGRYLGASYIADRLTYLLADPAQQKHLRGVEAYFRHEANVQILSVDQTGKRFLLNVFGPTAPGDYYVYDAENANLHFLMSARPWLEPERLARVEIRKSPMRDGTSITSYLTWPAGPRADLPLVVMPHGGPEMRDYMVLDPFAQTFAARGWLVLQPNFRGSGGYGKAFAEAGHGQWSARMQDDITDAANDLVASGIVDRNRIVIFGASYGGYAALAGAVVTPELYRAAVSLAGLSDLVEMLAWQRGQDGADSESYAYWVKSIGDPKVDATQLRAASPRLRAGEIRIPILLLHGSQDDVVPLEQSQIMQRALKKAGKQVELTTFPTEGHGGWSYDNEVRAIHKVIDFLEPHLRPGDEQTSARD